MWRRIWTLFKTRNHEFFRDKSALGWNFVFPFLIIAGFGFLFGDNGKTLYKAGIIRTEVSETASMNLSSNNLKFEIFRKTNFIEFIDFKSKDAAIEKLRHHRIDFLINPDSGKYWVSKSSPNGYIVEKLFHASFYDKPETFIKQTIKGREVPYVEWLFPGILGMNIMFSGLFGVGYVVVRYRKNDVLKRLSVTPLKPYEFLTSQILSRMYILLTTTFIVLAGCMLFFKFENRGSYANLFIIFALGGFSMVALGLIVASRSSSEEFAGGILNLITWPMMFLSEVWFSLEGAHPLVQQFSKLLPLTHLIDGARKIMNDGAGLLDIKYQVLMLTLMSIVFLVTGSVLFKWQKD
ncbi:MAG: ABC transporter permease [Desulfobacterales bacterium]|jgi:ABC-2 type transport system permease protein|nr:ABC transporter permease [Desulfobacteraceae bacterium]MBT7087087.1 ABC transporter permease [Desulfobacterales bacterium]MBT7698375.1 ABC transporter permease [Desulfobacterales bacterium]